LWRLLSGIGEDDWTEAIDMDGAQVAVADYRPDWWPANTTLLIRRVRLAPEQISADPRSRRRRTLHPDQRALPLDDLAEADAIYGYSFVLTNPSAPAKAAAVEHWYRHRTSVESVFRDSKLGAALRHLPSGYHEVNTAWMWGALLAATMAGWLHQLTASLAPDGALAGHGVRDGKAMIATLRHRIIRVPARLIRHAGQLVLRLSPGPARRDPRPPACPARPVLTTGPPARTPHGTREPGATPGPRACPPTEKRRPRRSTLEPEINSAHYSRIRV